MVSVKQLSVITPLLLGVVVASPPDVYSQNDIRAETGDAEVLMGTRDEGYLDLEARAMMAGDKKAHSAAMSAYRARQQEREKSISDHRKAALAKQSAGKRNLGARAMMAGDKKAHSAAMSAYRARQHEREKSISDNRKAALAKQSAGKRAL